MKMRDIAMSMNAIFVQVEDAEASLGRTTAALASGQGGDDILKLMQSRLARGLSRVGSPLGQNARRSETHCLSVG
jgi:hypothetical protein